MFGFKHNYCTCFTKGSKHAVWNGHTKFNGIPAEYDVLSYRNGYRKGQDKHSQAIPISLAIKIITVFSNKNSIVLDPFMGSGTTAVVCRELKRKFIGFEINPEYVAMAHRRMDFCAVNSILKSLK